MRRLMSVDTIDRRRIQHVGDVRTRFIRAESQNNRTLHSISLEEGGQSGLCSKGCWQLACPYIRLPVSSTIGTLLLLTW